MEIVIKADVCCTHGARILEERKQRPLARPSKVMHSGTAPTRSLSCELARGENEMRASHSSSKLTDSRPTAAGSPRVHYEEMSMCFLRLLTGYKLFDKTNENNAVFKD